MAYLPSESQFLPFICDCDLPNKTDIFGTVFTVPYLFYLRYNFGDKYDRNLLP